MRHYSPDFGVSGYVWILSVYLHRKLHVFKVRVTYQRYSNLAGLSAWQVMGVACDTLSFFEKNMSGLSVTVAYALSCLRQEHIVLKDKQLEVLQELYRGNDVFVWFPTGYGKSVCYQILPFLFDHKLKRTSSPALEQIRASFSSSLPACC